MDPTEALEQLRDGNRRFVDGQNTVQAQSTIDTVQALAGGQQPFAVILGCADSRVPVEVLFDQGPGKLFVVRVAGNFVTPAILGSIEYAMTQLGTRLIVLLGHSGCGAVQATLQTILSPGGELSPNLASIVEGIRPGIENGVDASSDTDQLPSAVRANVFANLERLVDESEALAELSAKGEITIVGAEYDLGTGQVDFLQSG